MITLQKSTSEAIRIEMESIPKKYQQPFNSVHEGLAVLREEYVELENEIFFGEKKAKNDFKDWPEETRESHQGEIWKERVMKEAVQVAAMTTVDNHENFHIKNISEG